MVKDEAAASISQKKGGADARGIQVKSLIFEHLPRKNGGEGWSQQKECSTYRGPEDGPATWWLGWVGAHSGGEIRHVFST